MVYGKEHVTDYESFYDISDVDIKKNEISMSRYKGKVLVLVLNVASKWVLSLPNYTQLVPKIIDEYAPKGFEVLVFPCNQFARGERNRVSS